MHDDDDSLASHELITGDCADLAHLRRTVRRQDWSLLDGMVHALPLTWSALPVNDNANHSQHGPGISARRNQPDPTPGDTDGHLTLLQRQCVLAKHLAAPSVQRRNIWRVLGGEAVNVI